MVSLLSEIHFWTTQEDVIVKHTDYGSFKYYNKKETTDAVLGQSKKQYCEHRGLIWNVVNKRPHKLKDKLKELEDHLVHNKIVYFAWEDERLKLLLSTGLIVNLTTNSETGDIVSIYFDKHLSAKLQVNIICDGVVIGNQVICICNDGHLLGYGGHWKDGWILEGGPRRKLNCHREWLAVWGKAGAEHPQPWSPLAKDHQRANLHLYSISGRDPELLAYKKTDGEPLQVVVSKRSSPVLVVIEQKVTQRGAVSVDVSSLELVRNNLKRVSVTSVPLQTHVSYTVLSDSEDRLLICCIDGSLAVLDRIRGTTRTIKATFIPTLATWHPDGAVVAILNERQQLQYYDTALNCIKSQLIGEDSTPSPVVDLSSYFNMQFTVASINWGPKDLFFCLEQGPIAIIKQVERSTSFRSLVKKYLNIGEVDKAIKLLLSWEFNEDAFLALQKIVAYLLRSALTPETAQHLQNALGSFHNSPVPISSKMRHKFGSQVYYLTRRFFHQLVRAQMFETAFLLAVDLGHHDLFMDLHYIAVKIGETEMAAAARAQASALLSRCSSEASDCSRSSCSQCSDTESSCSNDCNSCSNQSEDSKTVDKSNYIPPLPLNPDNCLTTDFNQPDPTTYRGTPDNESVPSQVQKHDYSRPQYAPRATYVKAPQVPSNFTKLNSNSINKPPCGPLPNLSNPPLGIPYLQSTDFGNSFHNNFKLHQSKVQYSQVNFDIPRGNLFNNNLSNTNPKPFPSSTLYSTLSSPNLPLDNVKKFGVIPNKVAPPPFPIIEIDAIPDSLENWTNCTQYSSTPNAQNFPQNTTHSSDTSPQTSNKKPHAKVKFSDTVTAFIVPEIKRPQRPPPPPSHVTDPQRELANSLPLCHPNEDYLKDFTPVRKDEGDEEGESQQSKIKVVHFGVV